MRKDAPGTSAARSRAASLDNSGIRASSLTVLPADSSSTGHQAVWVVVAADSVVVAAEWAVAVAAEWVVAAE